MAYIVLRDEGDASVEGSLEEGLEEAWRVRRVSVSELATSSAKARGEVRTSAQEPPRPLRVLIVDDCPFWRSGLKQLVEAQPDMQVIGTAAHPPDAVEPIRDQRPDALVLDLNMPHMDGLTFLRRIMAQRPIPVLVCSALTAESSAKAFEAMQAGAVDVIAKTDFLSPEATQSSAATLVGRIRDVARTDVCGEAVPAGGLQSVRDPQCKSGADHMELLSRFPVLSRQDLEGMLFGGLEVDAFGEVLNFNPADISQPTPKCAPVIGSNLFQDWVPAADRDELYACFRRGVAAGDLNMMFEWVLEPDACPWADRPVSRVRMQMKSAILSETYWVFVKLV